MNKMKTQSGYQYCSACVAKRFFISMLPFWTFACFPTPASVSHTCTLMKHSNIIVFLSSSFPPSLPSSCYTRLCAGAVGAVDLCVLHKRTDKPVPQVKRGGRAFHRRRPKTSWKKEVDKHDIHMQGGMNFCVTWLKNRLWLIRLIVTSGNWEGFITLKNLTKTEEGRNHKETRKGGGDSGGFSVPY